MANDKLLDSRDVSAALGFLTRLPVKVDGEWATARGARSSWAYPVAGLVIGAGFAAITYCALFLGLSTGIAAALGLVAMMFVTGALHEDGLADTVDGFWGGSNNARRLEIMKDSRIGTYGVLALASALLLHWLVVSALLDDGHIWALVAMPAASRAVMPAVMRLPHARRNGVSVAVGRPPVETAALAALIGIAFIVPLGWDALIIIALLAVSAAAMGALALRKIGGQTGDILGATQQVTQLVGWLTFLMLG
ncbi:MAG: adenosylcobinamide-GDP ribazoletransferase [Pseudomonadota bacterium]